MIIFTNYGSGQGFRLPYGPLSYSPVIIHSRYSCAIMDYKQKFSADEFLISPTDS